MLIMHSLVLASSQLILEGDIAGAERTLVALADQAGDHALVRVLDELPPKDLLAVMREFDASKESIINLLVTPEQFARAKDEAAVVGFVLGSSGGRGHGVYATGPARFTVLDFTIN